MNQRLVYLSPQQDRARQALIRLCQKVQKYTHESLNRELNELQRESGFTLVTKYTPHGASEPVLGCPQEVLLLPWDRLTTLVQMEANKTHRHYTSFGDGVTLDDDYGISMNALAQIEMLIGHFDDQPEHLTLISETLEELLSRTTRHPKGKKYPYINGGIHNVFKGILDSPEIKEDPEMIMRGPDEGRHFVKDKLAVYIAYQTRETHISMPPEDVVDRINRAQPRIEYYALKILLCAARLPSSLKSLTRVVRTHELSHLVTHLGLDRSDRHWADFYTFQHNKNRAHDLIGQGLYSDAEYRKLAVEGSAQELTHRLLESRLRNLSLTSHPRRYKQATFDLACFQLLLKGQSEPYRVHLRKRLTSNGQLTEPEQRRLYWIIFRQEPNNAHVTEVIV